MVLDFDSTGSNREIEIQKMFSYFDRCESGNMRNALFQITGIIQLSKTNSSDNHIYPCSTLYSYLMGVDAIDETICPEVLGMTKCSIA